MSSSTVYSLNYRVRLSHGFPRNKQKEREKEGRKKGRKEGRKEGKKEEEIILSSMRIGEDLTLNMVRAISFT